MNTEELKLVLDLVRDLGGEARGVLFAWFSVEVVKQAMIPLTALVIGGVVLRGIRQVADNERMGSENTTWVAAAKYVVRAWGADTYDPSSPDTQRAILLAAMAAKEQPK